MTSTNTAGPETRRILNVEPSRDPERDWRISHAEEAGVLTAAADAAPASVDLRESWWQIGNQGATGSCVGWATADSVIRWHQVKAGRLTETQHLSVRFIWMAAKETDEFHTNPTSFIEEAGTSLKAALDVARKYGVVRRMLLPFEPDILYPGKEKTFFASAAKFKINSYFNLGSDLSGWRRWLAEHGPILIRLGVDATWDDATANGGNLDQYKPDTIRGGHAVALVGYTADRFIVRNSWGEEWGDLGFGYASESYANDAFTESYGVVTA
jgi:hypothetical protein